MQSGWRIAGKTAFVLALAACSEHGNSPTDSVPGGGNGGNGGSSGGVVTASQRTAALNATGAEAGSLRKQGLTGDAFNQALADFLSKRGEFEASGIDVETSSVWARFKDGRLLIVPNNRELKPYGWRPRSSPGEVVSDPASGKVRAAAGNPTELPDPVQVRLFHSFGTGFAGQSVIDQVRPWLQNAGYTVAAGIEGDARAETLRHISGDGFFYFNTHGGKGTSRKGNTLFGMWTSTVADSAMDNLPANKADLDAERLVYMLERNGLVDSKGNPVYENRYAITYLFVEQYMSFGKNSILFFNVCSSGSLHPDVQAFVNATLHKNASVYIGWTKVLSDSLAYTALPYFVDRLLGANQFRPENPKQRPFPWPDVLQDMTAKGLALEPTTGAQLVAYPNTQSTGDIGGLLAPSIQLTVADQHNDELILVGTFGADPGTNGQVTIDDGSGPTKLTVKSWQPTQIKTDLPRTGSGASGDVVVTVRGHDSNPRRLTRWQGSLTYTLRDKGTLTLKVVMPVDFRMDPADFRVKPGQAPQPWPQTQATSNPRMVADFTASGSYSVTNGSCTTTYTWTGGGKLPWPSAVPAVGYLAIGYMDPAAHQMPLQLVVSTTYTQTTVVACSGGTNTYTQTEEVAVDPAVFDRPGFVVASTDAAMNISAGTRSGSVSSHVGGAAATASVTWALMRATPAYNPNQPR